MANGGPRGRTPEERVLVRRGGGEEDGERAHLSTV